MSANAASPPRRYAARLSAEERRPLLLDAALAVIVERGYAGATLDAIAERAGVTKPVIYGVFANRDDFLTALLDREEARALSAIIGAMPNLDRVSGRDELAALIASGVARFLRAVAAEPDPWRLILSESDATPTAVRERIDADRRTVEVVLRDVIATGLPLVGRPDLDPGLLAHAFFAVVERFARAAAGTGDIDADAAGAVVAALATGSVPVAGGGEPGGSGDVV